ncbi:MAG TPA: DUF2442 domain-containing protein [Pirellulales bacterium]|nr:DUF2442 domain-containing protein [Pirellulales bacterium]
MLFDVIESVVVEPEKRLTLLYRDGGRVTVDFNEIIGRGGVFAKLADPAFFRQVLPGPRGRSIEWPEGIDFCADALWLEAHGGGECADGVATLRPDPANASLFNDPVEG